MHQDQSSRCAARRPGRCRNRDRRRGLAGRTQKRAEAAVRGPAARRYAPAAFASAPRWTIQAAQSKGGRRLEQAEGVVRGRHDTGPAGRSKRRLLAGIAVIAGTSTARRRRHPGLRHRHQRQRRRDGQLQDQDDATAYRLDIYRMGYYGGNGARKITTSTRRPLPQTQPACMSNADRPGRLRQLGGLGVVGGAGHRGLRRLLRPAAPHRHRRRQPHRPFVVRTTPAPRTCSSDLRHDLAGVQHLRRQQPSTPARQRAAPTRSATTGRSPPAARAAEDLSSTPSTRWSASWSATATTSATPPGRHRPPRRPAQEPQGRSCRSATTSTGPAQRANVEAPATPASTWRSSAATRCSGRPAGRTASTAGTPYRTLVCYKETWANAKIDPTDEWTGTWRDPRFSPPADGGRPENALTGTAFMVNSGPEPDRAGRRRQDAVLARHTTWPPRPPARSRRWAAHRRLRVRRGRRQRLPAAGPDPPVHHHRPTGVRCCRTSAPTYASGTTTHHLTLYRARQRRAGLRRRHHPVVVGPRQRPRRRVGRGRPRCSRPRSTCSPTWARSRPP
jgi:hypothetical protein